MKWVPSRGPPHFVLHLSGPFQRRARGLPQVATGRHSPLSRSARSGIGSCDRPVKRCLRLLMGLLDAGDIAKSRAGRSKRRSIQFVEHLTGDGPTVFRHVCNMGWRASCRSGPDAPIAAGRLAWFPVGRGLTQIKLSDGSSLLLTRRKHRFDAGKLLCYRTLADGRTVEIVPCVQTTRTTCSRGRRTGTQSLQRRFFAVKRASRIWRLPSS